MTKAIKIEELVELQTLHSLQMLATGVFLLMVILLDNVCYI
jgi:hypothetical protein